ncbi:MAG: DUF6508 domain-containing protein [Spirochaetota bacterium]|nr:DUF6508 domain-containing protein [Spirochaetota bacterium]
MLLDENNYKEKLFAFTNQDWQPFIKIIHKIEKTSYFGELGKLEMVDKGVYQESFSTFAPIVSEFLEIVYNLPVIVNFNWKIWKEGWDILNDQNFDFDKLDIPTKCKLLTTVIRNDRFCEGALVSAFKSGLMLNILKSIEKELNSNNVN